MFFDCVTGGLLHFLLVVLLGVSPKSSTAGLHPVFSEQIAKLALYVSELYNACSSMNVRIHFSRERYWRGG